MDRSRLAIGRRWLGRGLLLAPLAFLVVFFFYPLGAIFELSFFQDGAFDSSGFTRIIQGEYYRQTLWFTTWQAALSTLLTLALALPGAHVFTRYRFPFKNLLLALATLPFVLPTVVVALAFSAWLGPNSSLNQGLMHLFNLDAPPIKLERTLTLILIAHVFYNYAVALRIISSFWANQNPRIQEAAQVLGANPLRLFLRVTLPLLMPAIMAAALLVFIFTFTSFGVVRLLGGLQYATLEVEIHYQTTALFNLPVAGALSVVQLGATLLMMIVYTALQRRMSRPRDLSAAGSLSRRPQNWRERLWVGANLLILTVLLLSPLLALVERSFMLGEGGFTTRYYEQLSVNERGSVLFISPLDAISNSLRYALLATAFALILGTLAAYLLAGKGRISRWLDPLMMLPLATSAVTLGFGFLIALDGDSWLDHLLMNIFGLEVSPLNLRRSFWLIPIAHTLVAMPFVVRSVLPALRGIQPNLHEAAATLGASAWRRWWRIDLPLIARSLGVGAVFAFTISMGEFGASVFIAQRDRATIPIAIFRFFGEPGLLNYGQALAMSVILMAVCAAGFVLIERLNAAVIGEF